jgi:chemotaxis protein histidine kinase CheA
MKAHTIKGLAGTIGAKTLQKIAQELEQAIYKKEMPVIHELLDRFWHALNKIIQVIQPYVRITPSVENDGTQLPSGNLSDLNQHLIALSAFLQDAKPVQIKEIVKEIKSKSWPDEIRSKINDILEQVKKYRYNDAAKIVSSLLVRLGLEL